MAHSIYREQLNKQEKRQKWREIVDDFIQSGLRQSEYCRLHGLKLENLSYYYLKWYPKVPTSTANFLPVNVSAQPMISGEQFSIVLVSGTRVDIPSQFSQTSLEKILETLRSVGC